MAETKSRMQCVRCGGPRARARVLCRGCTAKRGDLRLHRLAAELCTLTGGQWEAILSLYQGHCAYCGQTGTPLQMEHVIPLARGGAHAQDNVVPACPTCNTAKGLQTAEEYGVRPQAKLLW